MTALLESVVKDIPSFPLSGELWRVTMRDIQSAQADPALIDQLKTYLVHANAVPLTDEERLRLGACSRQGSKYPILEMATCLQVSGLTTPPSRTTLNEVARFLRGEIAERLREIKTRVDFYQLRVDAPLYVPRHRDQLLKEEVESERAALEKAEKELEALNEKHEGFFAKAGHLPAILAAKKKVKTAEADYEKALVHADEPPQLRKRLDLEAQDNARAKEEKEEQQRNSTVLAAVKQAHTQLSGIQKAAKPIFEAAVARQWFSDPAIRTFWVAGQRFLACRWGEASQLFDQITDYRNAITPGFYKTCRDTGRQILEGAQLDGQGYPAIVSHPGIAADSVALAKPYLRKWTAKFLDTRASDGEKWQALNYKIASPRALALDPLWVLYWTIFQTSQEFAKSIVRAGHEDVLTGELVSTLKTFATTWGAPLLPEFGYRNLQPNYIGAVKMAGTRPEHKIGADLAILLDISFGEFSCKKLALFQAKNSFNGRANVASKTDQLAKLAARRRDGYYLFYHRNAYMASNPGATIRPAHELWSELSASGSLLSGCTSLRVATTTKGWDLASFVTFGLADPASAHGTTYLDLDDAMAKMTSENLGLPRYVTLFSIGGSPTEKQSERLQNYGYQPTKLMDRPMHKQLSQGRSAKSKGQSH